MLVVDDHNLGDILIEIITISIELKYSNQFKSIKF